MRQGAWRQEGRGTADEYKGKGAERKEKAVQKARRKLTESRGRENVARRTGAGGRRARRIEGRDGGCKDCGKEVAGNS